MKDFAGRIAVVAVGGSGMGRELVRQLVAEGCNVATCDVFAEAVAETKRLCEADRPPQGLRVTTHIADVSDEAQVQQFRDEVAATGSKPTGGAFLSGRRPSHRRSGSPVARTRLRRRLL
jgi:NAD(P)-dependent dehydrogenase (short-subunit alcohol dehydrogenase family)